MVRVSSSLVQCVWCVVEWHSYHLEQLPVRWGSTHDCFLLRGCSFGTNRLDFDHPSRPFDGWNDDSSCHTHKKGVRIHHGAARLMTCQKRPPTGRCTFIPSVQYIPPIFGEDGGSSFFLSPSTPILRVDRRSWDTCWPVPHVDCCSILSCTTSHVMTKNLSWCFVFMYYMDVLQGRTTRMHYMDVLHGSTT